MLLPALLSTGPLVATLSITLAGVVDESTSSVVATLVACSDTDTGTVDGLTGPLPVVGVLLTVSGVVDESNCPVVASTGASPVGLVVAGM